VCATTGAPAETWRKFRFVTAPGWAYAFLLLLLTGIGLLLIFILMRAVSRTAGGYLPLTRAASNRIRNANLAGLGLAILWLVLWAVAFTQGDNSAAAPLFLLGFLVMFALLVYWLLVRPRFSVGGKVLGVQPGHMESVVVLERVHPAFVAAVQQHQQARVAQFQAAPPLPPAPPVPYAG
jgi:hypothetical protein